LWIYKWTKSSSLQETNVLFDLFILIVEKGPAVYWLDKQQRQHSYGEPRNLRRALAIDDWDASGAEAAGFVLPVGMLLVVPGTPAGTFPVGNVVCPVLH
jgi:hypothetical protein